MVSLILTVIGPDRPGLVNLLSSAVAAHGGSWLESRMARLAGQFAGIVRIEGPDGLGERLQALEEHGLRVIVQPAGDVVPAGGQRLWLEVVGNDRPGIVRDVTEVLAACGVNIEELTTGVESGAMGGGVLFRATARLRAPAMTAGSRDPGKTPADSVRAALEQLGNELMVDIQPEDEPSA